MKKRVLPLLLALVLLLSVVPSVSAEESFQLTYEQWGDTGEVTIHITGYIGTPPETLVIPDKINGYPVRYIGNNAFSDAPIKEVILPGTLLDLNTTAFKDNETLQSVTFGEGAKSVSRAFEYCINLKNVVLPSTMEKIGYCAFAQTAIESVDLPAGLKVIGERAFDCAKLKTITLPDGLKRIEGSAFWCNRAEGCLTIPASVTYLGGGCFYGNNFTSVLILPEKMEMEGFPFDGGCPVYAHRSVLEGNLYLIASHNIGIAFEDLPYDPVTTPVATEGSIQYVAVDGKAYLVSCDASGELTVPDTLGGCPVVALLPAAFVKAGGLTKLALPDSIEEIGEKCFVLCAAALERLPKNLKTLGYASFQQSGDKGMQILDGTIPDGVKEIPPDCFPGAKIASLILPAGLEVIGDHAFSGSGLKEVTFLGGVKTVGDGALSCNEFTEITIPEGLERLGDRVFDMCGSLEKLVLPHSLKEIGEFLFGYEPPKNLTVYGYTDTPILDYCMNAKIPFVDRITGEPVALPYEKEVDGVTYRISPARKTATIIGCNPDEIGSILVVPEMVDGCSVTRIDNWGLDRLPCVGLILPDTVTYIDDLAITAKDYNKAMFIRMPDNEVFIDKDFKNCTVCYFFLPEHFSLKEECRENADRIFDAKCIGYEAHKSFINEDQLITVDGTPDDRLMLTNGGVFRLDGKEYTAIYLTTVNPMPSAIGGVPITRVAASCALTSSTIILGNFVRVVEDGAFVSSNEYGEVYFNSIYVPGCIEYLPADFYPASGDCTIYGTGGGYAEKYAKEHGLQFAALDNTPFTDVQEDAWYFPYVHDAYWAGLMNGTSKTTFEPNGTTTRAMVVQVLFNLAGQEVGYYEIFKDVTYEDWFYHAVTWAYAAGVCNGTSATTFSPNDPVTREQLAAFLYRFTTLCGVECKADGDLSKFADQNQISGYAKDAISWAVGAGIINGKSPTTVAPRAYATRAEIAAMLCRLLDYINVSLAGA